MSLNLFNYLIFLVVILVVIFIISSNFKRKTGWKADVIRKINDISKKTSTRDPLILSTLVIEADKLLGFTMEMLHIKGKTVGDRLKNAKPIFDKSLYNRIWQAHKIRNQIAHEQNFSGKPSDLKNSIQTLITGIRVLV